MGSPPLVKRMDSMNRKRTEEIVNALSESGQDPSISPPQQQQEGGAARSDSVIGKPKGKGAKGKGGKPKLVCKEMSDDKMAYCVLHSKNTQIDFQFSTLDDSPDEVASSIVRAT